MATKAQLKAITKYDKNHTRSVMLKFNTVNDADILSKLDNTSNKQGYIKELLRADLRGNEDVLSIENIGYLIRPVIQRYKIEKVYLFGSYARGEATSQSDVNLLVEGGEISGIDDYLIIKQELQDRIGRGVDIVMGEAVRNNGFRSGKRFMDHFERDKVLIYG